MHSSHPAARSLSVCIASGTFHPDSGGPPTYLSILGRELVARGHRVGVVTYGDGHRRGHGGVAEVYPYPVTRIERDRSVSSRLALFAREVWRVGRDADLLFVNDYGLPATLANLVLRKPLVMKIVGDFAWEYAVRHRLVSRDEPLERFQARRHGPTVEAVRALQTGYGRRATLVLTPSRYVGRYVVGWGVPRKRVRVVPNAVGDPTAGLALDRDEARRRLGLPSDGGVVLVVARLTPWKGVDTLIRAMGVVRERWPNGYLCVVGDGPDRGRLESLASALPAGAVRFVGEVPHAEVGLYLDVADALALCSGYEGLSHVLLEAMAAGVPVVASSVGGNVEVVRDGENGLLVPFGEVGATAAALSRLLGEPELARRLAKTARQEAGGRTVERMVSQTLGVFYEAIGGRL